MWHTVDYAQVGRGHDKLLLPCQDKTITGYENGVYTLGLADGAGSAKYSHFGAETVLAAARHFLSCHFDALIESRDGRAVKAEVLGYLLKALEAKRAELGCELRDLASTILFVAVKYDRCIILHIGDGVIGMMKNNVLKAVSKPDNGEFANTTVFVTSHSALAAMRLLKGATEGIEGFVLMSDGSAESFYQKQSGRLAPVLGRIITAAAVTAPKVMRREIQGSFQVVIDNTQDDCSLAVMAKTSRALSRWLVLPPAQKRRMLGLSGGAASRKMLRVCGKMMQLLGKPKNAVYLAGRLRVSRDYMALCLDKLSQAGFIRKMRFDFYKIR